jgi:hypothetical protein
MARIPRAWPLALALAGVVAVLAAAPSAAAAPRISGADADVWGIGTTPTYRIVGTRSRVLLRWRIAGTRRAGRGRSPLTVRIGGLPSGRHRLIATQPTSPGNAIRDFRVDLIGPAIDIRSPEVGAVYAPGEVAVADYSCRGAVTCAAQVPSGGRLDTSRPGPASLTVTARDAAGNVGSLTRDYRVGPAAPVITARPPGPTTSPFPVFGWSPGAPGSTFTWQVLTAGVVVGEGDVLEPEVQVGPLDPGTYAFQVRESDEAGNAGPFSAPDPFTVAAGAVRAPRLRGRARPRTSNSDALQPRAGSRVTTRRPRLRWEPQPDTRLYNVQVFRLRAGRIAEVVSAFPRRARMRVPGGRLRSGERYAWRVWPYRAEEGSYTPRPLGVSFFDVVEPVRLDARQLMINQRVAQAAVRRTNAIERWLDAGITARDLRPWGLGTDVFGEDVTATGPGMGPGRNAAAPRRLAAPAPRRARERVRLSRRQLRINQRISQAAVRRVNALEARLAGGLTGGDVVDGAIGADALVPGVVITRARPGGEVPEATRTVVAPPSGAPARIRPTAAQALVNQRISQAALLRANALVRRLRRGLGGEAFRPGSLTAVDLAEELLR